MIGVSWPTFCRPPNTASVPSGRPTNVAYQRAHVIAVFEAIVLEVGEKMVVVLFAELRAPLTVRSPPEVSTWPFSISDWVPQKMSVLVELGSVRCELASVPSVGSQTS